jgi:DNA polymerase III delta prime subunit
LNIVAYNPGYIQNHHHQVIFSNPGMLNLDMTYLIIAQESKLQEQKVLDIVSKAFKRTFRSFSEISSLPDVHILKIEDKQSIGIEAVKDFQNEMVYKPFQEEKQFCIIIESEKLTHQAKNALLKTLEESDDRTIYLLCVNNEKNLLQTIRSRSKPIYVKKEQTLEDISSQEGTKIEKPEILEINLVVQFSKIEEIAKDKNRSLELINTVERYYKNKLKNEIIEGNIKRSKDIKKSLETISDCRTKVNANCNKRMVLESLVINLQSE